MDRSSNIYTIGFAVVMCVVVAVVLAVLASSLKERQDANELLFSKKSILKSVGIDADKMKPDSVNIMYDSRINGIILTYDMEVSKDTMKAEAVKMVDEIKLEKADRRYPLFEYTDPESNKKSYIVPLYGNGLWDKIWGYVALQDDFNTIAGVSFDHKSETPGLGAEIKDNPSVYEPFIGKKFFNADGDFVSVVMKKGQKDQPDHQIDAISGATITGDGVNDMMYEDVNDYLKYFDKLKKQGS